MNKTVLWLSTRRNKQYHCQPLNMENEKHTQLIVDLRNLLLSKLETLFIMNMMFDNIFYEEII